MQNRMLVLMAVGLLCVSAWGVPDANAPGQVRASTAGRVGIISSEGVDSTATPAARGSGDVPDGYQPPAAPEPTQCEPPQVIEMRAGADGGDAAGATPLWGPDVTVYPGSLRSPSPVGSER